LGDIWDNVIRREGGRQGGRAGGGGVLNLKGSVINNAWINIKELDMAIIQIDYLENEVRAQNSKQ